MMLEGGRGKGVKRPHMVLDMLDEEEEEEEVAPQRACSVVVIQDTPPESPPARFPSPVSDVPGGVVVGGRRARRKFCSSCVAYFNDHFQHLFENPPRAEFLQQYLHNYLSNFPDGNGIDYSSAAEVERIATMCMTRLQDEQEGVSSLLSQSFTGSSSDFLNNDSSIHPPLLSIHSSSSSSYNQPINSADYVMNQVLSIYPDASPAYITSLMDSHCMPMTDLTGLSSCEEYDPDTFMKVVTEMSEKGYDKIEKKKPKKIEPNGSRMDMLFSRDYTSTSWETDTNYRAFALQLLQNDFPFLRVNLLQKFFEREGKNHYFPTVQALEKLLTISRQKSYPISSDVIISTKLILKRCAPALAKANLKTKESWRQIPFSFDQSKGWIPLCAELQEEMEFLLSFEAKQQEARDRKMAEMLNEEMAEKDGALLECGCCCGEYAFEALVQCSEGHLFCRTCLQKYIENTLFGSGKTRLSCMSSAEGEPCNGTYSERFVENALPPLVYKRYQDAIAQEAVKAANIEGLLECHACGYQVELSSDAGNVLTCPSCSQQTCRHCKEEAHIPLKCSEVEKKNVTSMRVSVEEAMSEARIRECPNPKCKKRFFKTEGCNKMSCACGKKICYICRKDITSNGYNHFCQVPHCNHKSCGNCVLFTNSVEDDRLAMYDAGLKKMEEKKEDLINKKGTDNADISLDLNNLLEGGAIKKNINVVPKKQRVAPVRGRR